VVGTRLSSGCLSTGAGRFAPSPTGELHLGNLRTALEAFLSARAAGLRFLVRFEDLDRVTSSRVHEATHLRDLAGLGLDWDAEPLRQSERFERYEAEIAELRAGGRVYECYCTRREIREAAAAPHGEQADGTYPGTCRDLSTAERARRRGEGRPAALRLRADGESVAFVDRLAGPRSGVVDDVVLRRNDGVPAYNLAVVVDDAAQHVVEVCRGDDLLSSTPRQLFLGQLLGLPRPSYLHVPLVLAPDGNRLAKRHGAVTLPELVAAGHEPAEVRAWLAASLGLAEADERPTIAELVERFAVERLVTTPWVFAPQASPP
jgi:glutamyl-tRNA synthetase